MPATSTQKKTAKNNGVSKAANNGSAKTSTKKTATSRTSIDIPQGRSNTANAGAQKTIGHTAQSNNASQKQTSSTPGTGKSNLSKHSTTQLEKFFHDQLKDLYWAEKHLTKALPKMQKAATTTELKTAIQDHTAQTQEHVSRLEQVFQLFGKKAQAKKCDAMEGLVKEGETAVEETQKGSMTRDVAIIMSSQKVEHYEIASYGTLVQLAETMGNDEAAAILQTTLDEEKLADENLTSLATNNINWEAEAEGEEEEEEETQEDEE